MGIFGFGGEKKPSEWQQATSTQEKTDWTHFLSPEATTLLRSMLEDAYLHREAYFKAEDIKNAQLWSAIIELKKQINEINEKLDRVLPKEAHRAFRPDEYEADKRVIEKIKSVMQPTVEDTRDATNALVNSLMKF